MSLTLTGKAHPNLTQNITYVREKAWLRKARVVDPSMVALLTVYSPYIRGYHTRVRADVSN